jgi:isopentenyl diphosphate isomerase/L-lactate dehydrogenase-like FMN-dependent dehydrogenase
MSSGWFETVAEAQRRARKQLPKSVYWAVMAGSEQGATLADNVTAFGELGFAPHLDGTLATIRVMPAISAAVGGQAEVLLDGGIRRGGDVVKALALGAKAVMIGRAYLWGLAANGQAGVENVLDILRGGIDSALLGLGKASIRDLTPDDVVVPPGFTRTLGGDRAVLSPVLGKGEPAAATAVAEFWRNAS